MHAHKSRLLYYPIFQAKESGFVPAVNVELVYCLTVVCWNEVLFVLNDVSSKGSDKSLVSYIKFISCITIFGLEPHLT